jgi:hypothetical protein
LFHLMYGCFKLESKSAQYHCDIICSTEYTETVYLRPLSSSECSAKSPC